MNKTEIGYFIMVMVTHKQYCVLDGHKVNLIFLKVSELNKELSAQSDPWSKPHLELCNVFW